MKAEKKYEVDHSRTTYFTTVVNGKECTRKRIVLMLVQPPEPKPVVVRQVIKPKRVKKEVTFIPLF